ncbi:MAG: RNA polymerase sigma-70 factor [Ignavibacteriaceae bacterium]
MADQNYNDLPDDQIVKAIINNDHSAFKNLYYKYYPKLIRFAWYRLHSADSAKELVQELFFRIWIKRHNLNPDKSVKAYLYKSLNNLIINHLKLGFSKTVSIEDIKNPGSFDNEETKRDLIIDVEREINNLPEKVKTVYILSRVEGYKYEEIAEICNISIKAVEKRMSKAFNFLRKAFK